MHYTVWFPASRGDNALLALAGLNEESPLEWKRFNGPNNATGIMATWADFDAYTEFEWFPDPDAEQPRYWVGINHESPVLPSDLAYERQFGHRHVLLADGNHWRVPTIEDLPSRARLVNGTWRRAPIENYRELADRQKKIERAVGQGIMLARGWMLPEVKESDLYVSDSDGVEFLIDLLKLNYRLSSQLVSVLNLFTEAAFVSGLIIALQTEETKMLSIPVTVEGMIRMGIKLEGISGG